jgi:hypothetical protein
MFQRIAFILFTFTILVSSLSSFLLKAIQPDIVDSNLQPESLCGKGNCPITKNYLADTTDLSLNDKNANAYICEGNPLLTDNTKINDICYLQNDTRFFPKPSTLTFVINIFRLMIYILCGLSFFAILGGLIATIFFSVKRKKFAVIPFLVVVGGILFFSCFDNLHNYYKSRIIFLIFDN